jgi:hypothetical protein
MSAERRIGRTYPSSEGAASASETTFGVGVREALRALRTAGATLAATEPALELRPAPSDPPRLQQADACEGVEVRARAVPGEPVVGVAAFLDGIQESRVLGQWPGGVPLVHGTVAATIRRRDGRTLTTWSDDALRVERALFVPRAVVGDAAWRALGASYPVRDTIDDGGEGEWHPHELTARALSAVQRRREAVELHCAELWCQHGDGPLFVDGGIAGAGAAAFSALAIGVVKSHRTLYVNGDALSLVLALRAGERTTAFTVASPRRAPVASWYLRLRDASSRDPLWGLVRVEVAVEGATTERADLVSRWLLAERAPVSLPDPRWGAMAYGVRLTEEYLRALTR